LLHRYVYSDDVLFLFWTARFVCGLVLRAQCP
jgi:hypothetical protein